MSLKDAEKLAIKILKQVMEEKLSATNIEMVTLSPAQGYRFHSVDDMSALVAEANQSAAALVR
jgi:20S proteasome subunit alpha 5